MEKLESPPEIKLITGEELLDMGDIGRCELIDGRIVFMSPTGFEHGLVELNLGAALKNFVRQRQLGSVVVGEVGIYIRRNPDHIRAGDIVFIAKEKLETQPVGFLEFAPNLVVEIMSPHDRWQEVREKLADYFSIGVEQVWIVEPANRKVLIHRSTTDLQEFSEGDILVGEGSLAGFQVDISTLFEE